MGQSKPFSKTAFDPETLEELVDAYELAIAKLHDGGQPETVRGIIAGRTMTAARGGERDVHRLCRAALRGIALPF